MENRTGADMSGENSVNSIRLDQRQPELVMAENPYGILDQQTNRDADSHGDDAAGDGFHKSKPEESDLDEHDLEDKDPENKNAGEDTPNGSGPAENNSGEDDDESDSEESRGGDESEGDNEIDPEGPRVPARLRYPPLKDAADQFTHIPLIELPDNEYDRTCAICLIKYETVEAEVQNGSVQPQAMETERALGLPCCRKTIGERCLLQILGKLCPFCRAKDAAHPLPQDRAQDLRRWLCWIIRRHGMAKAGAMWDQWLAMIETIFNEGFELFAGDIDGTDRLRRAISCCRLKFDRSVESTVRKIFLESDDAALDDVEQWMWEEAKGVQAIFTIQSPIRLEEPVLTKLAFAQYTDEDRSAYAADEKYGANGDEEDYRIARLEGGVCRFYGVSPSFRVRTVPEDDTDSDNESNGDGDGDGEDEGNGDGAGDGVHVAQA